MDVELREQAIARLVRDIEWVQEFEVAGLPLDADVNFGVVARTLGTTPERVAAAVRQYNGDAVAVVAAIEGVA